MVFYQVVDKKSDEILSFSAAFKESEIKLFDLPFKFAEIMSKIPMDNYNRKQRLAISEMLNKSACIGRIMTVVAVPDTPKKPSSSSSTRYRNSRSRPIFRFPLTACNSYQ